LRKGFFFNRKILIVSFLLVKELNAQHLSLMSSNFCPHLIFKFGDLIEFSVLKD